MIVSARPRHSRPQLAHSQDAAKCDQSTQRPEKIDLPHRLGNRSKLLRSIKNARTEHIARYHSHDGYEPQLAL